MPTFAEPVYFWMLLALLPLFLLRFRAHRLSSKGTPGLVATRLSKDLVIGANPWLRWLSFTFHCLALTFLVVALARPQWGHEEVVTESEGRNIIIAVDTSRSMLATDLLPDRLTRARLAAQDLVDSLPNDRIGLIAFAGRSFLQAPLTMDHLAVMETLNQLDTEIIPRGGTNINSAVTMAIETFQKADSKDNALILFSDGEDLEGAEALAQIGKDAENLGLIIVAIGVGTEAGSIIPDPNANGPGVFIKNDGGDIVRSRLDPRALQQLSAHTSRGIYLNLGAANSITDIVGKALAQIEVSRQDEVAKKRPIERFAWALVLALISMLTAFLLPISLRGKHMSSQHRPQSVKTSRPKKRSQLPPPLPTNVNTAAKSALILLASFFTAALSQAQNEEAPSVDPTAQESAPAIPATSDDETPNVPALEAFQNEDYDTAVNNYKQEIATAESPDKESWLQFGLGSAAYRAGDFELAEQSFGKVLERQNRSQITADAHYNLGNTLFRHGQALLKAGPAANDTAPSSGTGQGDMEGATRQWKAALEHYQAALKTQPGHTLSTQNLKTVGLHLKQLKKQQEEQKKKDEEEKEEDKDKEEEEEDKDKEDEKDKDKDKDEDKDKDKNKDNSQDPNQDPNQDQDQKPNPDDSKGDQEPPEDQDKNKGDQKPPENKDPNEEDGKDQKSPPPSDSKDPDDQKKQSEKPQGQPKDQKDSEQKPGEKQDPQKQQKGEPQQKDPEGNLKANPNQQQPTQPADTREGQEDQKRNPETGFSPLEARRLLQSLSDEDLSVKPLIRPSSAQPYKNW